MEEKEILSGIAGTITDKPVFTITIPVKEPKKSAYSIWDRIRFKARRLVQLERTFVINPCVVNNMYRIAGRAALLPDSIKNGTLSETVLPLITHHLDDIIYIVAAGIQNTKREPDHDLIEFIKDNFDAEDLYNCLNPVLENVGMQSFLNSIALAKGTVKILKPNASPKDGRELIASHTQA